MIRKTRVLLCLAWLMCAGTLSQAEAETFHLKLDKLNRSFGPFEYRDGTVLTIAGTELKVMIPDTGMISLKSMKSGKVYGPFTYGNGKTVTAGKANFTVVTEEKPPAPVVTITPAGPAAPPPTVIEIGKTQIVTKTGTISSTTGFGAMGRTATSKSFGNTPQGIREADSFGSLAGPMQAKNLSLDMGKGLRMDFVWIEALGCWVGKYEVTNEQFRRFAQGHDSKSYGEHSLNGAGQPVVNVSLNEAVKFARWLTKICAAQIPEACYARLPSQSQWLTYARCGDDRRAPWGHVWPPTYGNYHDKSSAFKPARGDGRMAEYNDGYPVTCPVEKSGKNEWGLFGVGGNVWEFIVMGFGNDSMACGASWCNAATYESSGALGIDSSSSCYSHGNKDVGSHHTGFRLLIDSAKDSPDIIRERGWGDKVTDGEIRYFVRKANTTGPFWHGQAPIEHPAVQGTVAQLLDEGMAAYAFSQTPAAQAGKVAVTAAGKEAGKFDKPKLVVLSDMRAIKTPMPHVVKWQLWVTDRASLSRCIPGKTVFVVHTGDGECMVLPSVPTTQAAMEQFAPVPVALSTPFSKMPQPTASNQNPWMMYVNAVYAGDLAGIDTAIKAGLKVDHKLFGAAIHSKHCETVLPYVLKLGPDANEANSNHQTPLQMACSLLERGTTNERRTKLATMLIEAGANPNVVNIIGQPPLTDAVMKNNAPLVKLLLDGGGDPSLIDLTWDQGIKRELAKHRKSNSAIVQLLDSSNQAPRSAAETFRNVSPYMTMRVGAFAGRKDIIEFALAQGASPFSGSPAPLESVVRYGHPDSVKVLLAAAKDAPGREAGIAAAWNKLFDVSDSDGAVILVGLLADEGADIKATRYGDTLLHRCAQKDRPKIAEKLLALNADRTIKNKRDETPLETARKAKKPRMIALLENAQ